ncbi:MAG: hypothetical protein LBU65_06765 [Planctomycetaceae bacterium]|jgi:hypothetical protein|nr:hypothetical protein [Planctomycetaceae bacterium]
MALFKKKEKNTPPQDTATESVAEVPASKVKLEKKKPEKNAASPPKPKVKYKVDLYTYILATALFLLLIALVMLLLDTNRYKTEGVLPISLNNVQQTVLTNHIAV